MAAIADPLEQLTLEQLRRRSSMKWRTFAPDVLPLWVAEMDVPLAEPVRRTLADVLAAGDTGYAIGTAYAEAMREFARRRWAWAGVVPERSALAADVMIGCAEVLQLLTGRGDAVVVNPPVYPPFYAFVEHIGRRVVEAPLGADGRLELNRIEAAFRDERPAAYLLCSPHNPTGTVHTRDELAQVAALARHHGVRVVADEAHGTLALPGTRFVPYLSVPGAEDALAVTSAAKGWNLAGLKAALILAGPDATGTIARLPEIVSHGPSHLGVLAHTAALQAGDAWLDALLGGLDRKRTLLGELLAAHLPEVRYRPPQASFLAWLDCRALGLAEGADAPRGDVTISAGPAAFFAENARVALSAGPAFGTGGAGHVRLNFATSGAILSAALRRMGAAAHPR